MSMELKLMGKINLVEQLQESDCGLACLTMLFNYYDYGMTLRKLKAQYLVSEQGLSFSNLIDIAKEHSFNMEGYILQQTSDLAILSGETPFIASWDKNSHFVVVEKVKKNKYFVFDPNVGRLIYDEQEFAKLFCLSFLKVTGYNGEAKKNIKDNYSSIERMLKSVVINNKMYLLAFFIIGLVVQLVNVAPPLLYGGLLDKVIAEDYSINLSIIALIFGLILTLFLVAIMQEFVKIRLEYNMDFSILNSYYKHFLNLPIKFFKNKNQGELIYRFNLLEQFKELIVTHGMGTIFNVILVIVYSCLMLSISVDMGIVVIVFSIIFIIILSLFSNITLMLSKKVILSNSKVQECLAESIQAIDTIKLNGGELRFEEQMKDLLSKYLSNLKKSNFVSTLIESGVSTIRVVQTMLTFLIGIYFLKQETITIGNLLSFVVLSESFFIPIYSIINSYFFLVNLSSTFDKISDVLESKKEEELSHGLLILDNIVGMIEFRNVYFRYSTFEPYVLENFCFIIKPGSTIRLKGNSGVGKSTIIKLIMGYYEVESGSILIDGVPVNELNKKAYRKKISVILKDSQLLNGNIRDNIIDNSLEYKERELLYTNEMLPIVEQILTNGNLSFETKVSEGGRNLSEGQKQRVLLAKSFFQNNDVIIWDEATNSLDKETESMVFDLLDNLSATKILVTHDNLLIGYEDSINL